jgi:predicted AlkP superfamily pyrophosphatase or phosphodiesterase
MKAHGKWHRHCLYAGTGASTGSFIQPSTFFGQHGYDPKLPEMKAIFYGAGPDFERRRLNDIDAVDVAPTRRGAARYQTAARRAGKKACD